MGLGCGAGPEAGSRGRSRTKHGTQGIISGGGQSVRCAARSGRIDAERGRHSSAGVSSSICQPDFHHSKEGFRQGTSRGEFESAERVRALRALQDGRIEAAARSPSARRLAGEIGPEGCLLRGANPPRFQETAPISVVRSAVPISVLAFRPEQRAKGVHQAHEGSDGDSAQPRCAPDYLSGRPADYGIVGGGSTGALAPGNSVVTSTGISHQLQEVGVDSCPEHLILGLRSGHSCHGDAGASGEDPEASPGVHQASAAATGDCSHVSLSVGALDIPFSESANSAAPFTASAGAQDPSSSRVPV